VCYLESRWAGVKENLTSARVVLIYPVGNVKLHACLYYLYK
jgi:hypothetical protein